MSTENKDLQLEADKNKGGKGEENKQDNLDKDNTQEFYTKAEVEKMLQAEADRRVSQARKKFESELQQKIDEERKEAEKLAQMSQEEKVKHTLEEQRKQLEQREQELLQKELKLETVKILSEKGLPVGMIDMLVTTDADATMNNIEAFETAFRNAVEEAVNKRLGTTSGTPGSGASGQMITREEFKKLDYRSRLKLMNEDSDLYNKLSKELD